MKGNDLPFLQSIYKTCIAKIKETSLVAPGDMVGLLENGSVLRDFNAEAYIPSALKKDDKSVFALWYVFYNIFNWYDIAVDYT